MFRANPKNEAEIQNILRREISRPALRKIFDTNTFGVMAQAQAVIPQMRERRSGVIANVTSSATLAPMPLASAYTASKQAVEGFTGSLAYELEFSGAARSWLNRDMARPLDSPRMQEVPVHGLILWYTLTDDFDADFGGGRGTARTLSSATATRFFEPIS